MVGVQVDVVRQQSLQAFFHPAHYAAVLSTPKQTMVHKNGVGFGGNGGINQFTAGRDTRNNFLNVTPSLDLQTVGSVVLELFGLQ